MYFRTHFAFNLMIFLIFVKVKVFAFNLNSWPLFLILFIATAMPDIDIAGSWLSRKIKPASNLLHVFTKHRGFFHSLLACLLFSIIILIITKNLIYFLIFFVFYFLHVFLDCLNPSGTTLFWPSKSRIKGFVKFGGLIETILFILFSFASIFLIMSML